MGSQRMSSSWRAFFPMRIGGFDQIKSKRVSSVTSSGCLTTIFDRPRCFAFLAVKSEARSLVYTDRTSVIGYCFPRVRAIGPHHDPMYRNAVVRAYLCTRLEQTCE